MHQVHNNLELSTLIMEEWVQVSLNHSLTKKMVFLKISGNTDHNDCNRVSLIMKSGY